MVQLFILFTHLKISTIDFGIVDIEEVEVKYGQ